MQLIYWIYLLAAIISEVIATSSLKLSEGFSNLIPSIVTIIGYIASFFFLSLAIKTIPLSIAYTLWAGIGTVAIVLISIFVFKQSIDIPAILGIVLISVGVIVIQLFSSSVSH